MRKTIAVIYHSPCHDGFCAAWVINRVFRNRPGAVEFYPTQYGSTPISTAHVQNKEVYFLDFSYPLVEMQRIQAASNALIVLDHHQTAEKALEALEPRQSDTIIFDMDKSGARLTWEHFFPDVNNAHWLVKYTEDRDLWKHQLPNTKEINAALTSYPFEFNVWDELGKKHPDIVVVEGTAILRYQQIVITKHVGRARDIQLANHTIRAVNAPYELSSDTAHALTVGYPFAATWFQDKDGQFRWSLRSEENGIDVSEIAKRYGGGGHKHAAGFESNTLHPDTEIVQHEDTHTEVSSLSRQRRRTAQEG